MNHTANDYLIRGDQFVRDFEGMYHAVADPWNQAAEAAHDVLTLTAFGLLRALHGRRPFRSILDVGCGPGHFAPMLLALAPGATYTGIDVSPTAITQARAARLAEARFEIGDVRGPLGGPFDLIFCGKVLYYVGPEIDRALDSLSASLAPNGVLCSTYNQRPDSFSNRFLTYRRLDALVAERGLRLLVAAELHQPPENEALAIRAWTAP